MTLASPRSALRHDFLRPLRHDDSQIVPRLAAVVARMDHVAVLGRRVICVEGVADRVFRQ